MTFISAIHPQCTDIILMLMCGVLGMWAGDILLRQQH